MEIGKVKCECLEDSSVCWFICVQHAQAHAPYCYYLISLTYILMQEIKWLRCDAQSVAIVLHEFGKYVQVHCYGKRSKCVRNSLTQCFQAFIRRGLNREWITRSILLANVHVRYQHFTSCNIVMLHDSYAAHAFVLLGIGSTSSIELSGHFFYLCFCFGFSSGERTQTDSPQTKDS